MLQQIGYFDERFFLYYEEVDLCRRFGTELVRPPLGEVEIEIENALLREEHFKQQGYAIVNISLKPEGGIPGDATAGQMRAVHSDSPKTLYAAAVAQYCSAGFSKYLMPLRRGVTQSPDCAM